jgi:hypothetical protein
MIQNTWIQPKRKGGSLRLLPTAFRVRSSEAGNRFGWKEKLPPCYIQAALSG